MKKWLILNKLKNIVKEILVYVNKFKKILWDKRKYQQHQRIKNGIVYFDYKFIYIIIKMKQPEPEIPTL